MCLTGQRRHALRELRRLSPPQLLQRGHQPEEGALEDRPGHDVRPLRVLANRPRHDCCPRQVKICCIIIIHHHLASSPAYYCILKLFKML